MTSYEFEKAAKNAVIKVLNKNISIEQLDLVWFAHELGYKKCTIWGPPMGDKYAEVTYNRDKDEMYVDIYKKISNTKIPREEFDMQCIWLDVILLTDITEIRVTCYMVLKRKMKKVIR